MAWGVNEKGEDLESREHLACCDGHQGEWIGAGAEANRRETRTRDRFGRQN